MAVLCVCNRKTLSDDVKWSLGELDSAVGYSLLDPTWAAQDNTSTEIGNFTIVQLFCLYDILNSRASLYLCKDGPEGRIFLEVQRASKNISYLAVGVKGYLVAFFHSFSSNLPQEWLEGTHIIVKHSD